MKAWLSGVARVDFGGNGAGAPVAVGYCNQDRIEIATVPSSYPTSPQLTVEKGTRYVTVACDSRVFVYAGPSSANAATRQARAQAVPGDWTCCVNEGDVVHVWLAA